MAKLVTLFLTEGAFENAVGKAVLATMKSGGKVGYGGEVTEAILEEHLPGVQFAGRKEFPYSHILVVENPDATLAEGEKAPVIHAFPTIHIPVKERKVYPKKETVASAGTVAVPDSATKDQNDKVGAKDKKAAK